MPVPTLISELSQTASSNSPAGSESPTTADDYFRTYASFIAQLRDGKGFTAESDVASAATADIGAVNSYFVRITGTTTITSFGTNYNGPRFVRFAGILTLTHNATTLILPTGANITTAAGDTAIVVPVGNAATGWQVVAYQKANGQALVSTTDYLNTTRIDVASAATVDLTTNAPNTRHINITGTTTITAFTVAAGQTYFVRFNASLTLTNNASIVTNLGQNIGTAAGDTCIIRATASNTVEVLSYVRASVPAQTFLGADVALNNTANYFNIVNTGSIGAAGQVWKIKAHATFNDTTSAASVLARLWDGASVVYAETETATAGASLYSTLDVEAVVTLTAATTFYLSMKDRTNATGSVKTTGNAGTANKATWIIAQRVA